MRQSVYHGLLAGLLGSGAAAAQEPSLSFTGYVDADFVTSFAGGGFQDPVHTTGLEVDLTTTITFSPRLNAELRTTMTDGVVPAQGAGNTWAGVRFDGAALNWRYDDRTLVHAGDQTYGTGYFNYYYYKRSAMVVGEHSLRGVGVTRDGLTVATGATGLGAVDTAGNPRPTSQWATFVKYDYAPAPNLTITPSARYTAGVPGATPVTGGLSFDGAFGALTLSADAAVSYHNGDYDAGYAFLLEPSFSAGSFSVSATLFVNSPIQLPDTAGTFRSVPDQTQTGASFDNLLVYVEPAYAFNRSVALGLPLEFHDADGVTAGLQGFDRAAWVVPTLYLYPGSAVQWWIWGRVIKPLQVLTGGSGDLVYAAGSEILFRF